MRFVNNLIQVLIFEPTQAQLCKSIGLKNMKVNILIILINKPQCEHL